MSLHTGTVGTPPRKSRWHIESPLLLAVVVMLIVLLVAAIVWWLAGTMLATQTQPINPVISAPQNVAQSLIVSPMPSGLDWSQRIEYARSVGIR